MNYTIIPNEAYKSLEISFTEKPSIEVREALKGLRFRWHNVKHVWYGYATEEATRKAIDNATEGKAPKRVILPKKVAEKVNKYGVKVGDVFYMNWGWEQTNVDFFQVCELVGEASVRIRHVNPKIVDNDACGPMCANYTYDITPEPMPRDNGGLFVKDNEKGMLKRVCKNGDSLYLNMTSYANAYKIPFGIRKEYVSWYA